MSDIGAEMRIWAFPIAALFVVGVVAWATLGWSVAFIPFLLASCAAGLLIALNHGRVQGWWEGQLDAERRTTQLLQVLHGRGHRVLHGRTLPGSQTPLDHLVVGPSGIFAVTSRRFHRQIPMRTMYKELYHGPESQRDILERASRQAGHAAAIIGDTLGRHVDVTPTVVIHGPHVPWKVLSIRGVDVLSSKRLRRYIAGHRRRLGAVEIERVTAAAEGAFPEHSGNRSYAARADK